MKRTEGWWKTLKPELVAQQPHAHVLEVLEDLNTEFLTSKNADESREILEKIKQICWNLPL